MIWIVDDDGSAFFRVGIRDAYGMAAMVLVDMIIADLRRTGIEVQTDKSFTRHRRDVGTEIVWAGHILDIAQVPSARSYFRVLAEIDESDAPSS